MVQHSWLLLFHLSFKLLLVSPVGGIQVSCYRILNSLYVLGTTSSIYMEGYSLLLIELHLHWGLHVIIIVFQRRWKDAFY